MMNFSLEEIAAAAGGELVLQNGMKGDANVTAVVMDSRQVREGCVFLAVQGQRADGHQFAAEVFAAGAALVITQKTPQEVEAEHGCSASDWGSYLLVENTLQALSAIAEAYRRKLSVRVVGITGSVGKTSTKEMVAATLAQKYRVQKTEGNFNNEIGVPLTLLRIESETEVAVVEMGISDFGEMHRLSRMARPDICVITNIGQSHLENLKSREGILKAKSEIFDFMAEDGEICLNGGDDMLAGLSEINGHVPHFFGLGEHPAEESSALDIVGDGLWGSDASLRLKGEEDVKIHVPLPGVHMVRNAAAAACVGWLLGMTPGEIAAGIETAASVTGRNNLLRLENYTVIDDCYNANPASMKAALDLLAMADTEKIAILGDMFELGEDSRALHAELGAYAKGAGLRSLYCIGGEAKFLYDEAKRRYAAKDIYYFPTKEAMIAFVKPGKKRNFPKGCTILVKASHGMEFTEILEFLKAD